MKIMSNFEWGILNGECCNVELGMLECWNGECWNGELGMLECWNVGMWNV